MKKKTTEYTTIGVAEDTKLCWPDHRRKGCSVLRWEAADALCKMLLLMVMVRRKGVDRRT